MKLSWAFPVTLLICCSPANWAQSSPGIVYSPGAQAQEKAQDRFDKSIPPPPQIHTAHNPQQLQREADELSQLAQSVPKQVEQLQQGVLSKDLIDKLKRIEKLSKQLRAEVTQK